MKKLDRRSCLRVLGGLGFLAGCSQVYSVPNGENMGGEEGEGFSLAGGGQAKDRRFLIVLTASGGASIIDSAMALSRTEVQAAGGNPDTLNCFADAQLTEIPGLPFRSVKVDTRIAALGGYPVATDQARFFREYGRDVMVATLEGTSVNHGVAQRRSVTGNDAWSGRTLQEVIAATYGQGLPMANLNLGAGGFAMPGIDHSLPEYARSVSVTDAAFWPLGLHSELGTNLSLSQEFMERARNLRRDKIEGESNFWHTFRSHREIHAWQKNRRLAVDVIEKENLSEKLYWFPKSTDDLRAVPEADRLREIFPQYERDSFDAQAILAYLAITQGVSCAVTLGPDSAASTSAAGLSQFYNPPIAFDFSHTDHRGTQAMMWERMFRVAGKLIDLLSAKEFKNGESYWDRTMIYFATDFGRSRERAAGSEMFSSGHDLNNGVLVVSPMARGGRIFGGVDPRTGMTYGFDPRDGRPLPGRKMSEREIYAGLLNIMGVSGPALPDMSILKRL